MDRDSLAWTTPDDSRFQHLKLLERCEGRLHELGLAAVTLQQTDQVVDLGEGVVQRGLCRLGLLQDGAECAGTFVLAVLFWQWR